MGNTDPRWAGIKRGYTAEEVVRLRGTVPSSIRSPASAPNKLWKYLHEKPFVNALGALTGNQAMQQVKAGLKAIYLSGWQVAADANVAGEMYPDQSLYPANSVPQVVKRINNTLLRADQLHHAEGDDSIDFLQPIVADAEAGFGGVLNAFELMKAMIEAGAAGVHFEDQLASVKKCGHMGGKVLVPTREAVQKLIAARLAADVDGRAHLDRRAHRRRSRRPADHRRRRQRHAVLHRRAHRGRLLQDPPGLDQAISRGLAYAPYADLVWCETGKPDLDFAKKFAEAIHAKFPGKLLAYNCSPSFNWKKNLDDATIAKFQKELAAMGYKFQFITLAGFHALNYSMFNLAYGYARSQMSAFVELQESGVRRGRDAASPRSSTSAKSAPATSTRSPRPSRAAPSSTTALKGSTEEEQFHGRRARPPRPDCQVGERTPAAALPGRRPGPRLGCSTVSRCFLHPGLEYTRAVPGSSSP